MILVHIIWIALLALQTYAANIHETISLERVITRRVRQAQSNGCGGNLIVTSARGSLTSPNYPASYPSNSYCRWLLTAQQPGAAISLKINTLIIEPDTDCKLDYLQVYLGETTLAPSLGPFCGQINDRLVNTNSSRVLLVFHSDPVYEDKGFFINYYTQPHGGCQPSLMGDTGTLQSPGFPKNYPDRTDCWISITVSAGKQISLTFETLDLEFDEKCAIDYVQIYDGLTQNSTLLGQVCQGVQKFDSSGNSLLLHFHSDETFNKKGYSCRYEAIDKRAIPVGDCLWQRGKTNGTIASPNHPEKYPEGAACNIWLIAPEGHWIVIVFDAFRLEPDENCGADYLQIREGSASESKIIGTFCDGNEPKNITSTKNEVHIIFHSDDDFQLSGFKLRYWFMTNQTDAILTPVPSTVSAEKIVFTSFPQNTTLSMGSSHMLRCSVQQTSAKIRWLKGDQLLSGGTPLSGLKLLSNNSLWIQSMDHHLSGVYTCAAVSAWETAKISAYVFIENDSNSMNSGCGIVFRKIPKHSTFAEGEFTQLECLASGEHVRTSWEKDGEPLRVKGHMLLLRNGVLYIDGITKEDAGVYTCRAYDEVTNCQRRTSALVQVSQRADIEKMCGKPRVGQPSEDVPQMDHGKIIGGHNAKKGAYPWQVMLWEPSLKSFCGGTLLNERWIATAAHCFVNYKNLRWDRVVVKLGKYDREQKEDHEFVTGIADSSSIVVHPHYKKATFDNDLALIRLRDYVQFTDYILPICLGDQEIGKTLLRGDEGGAKMGTVVGWGKLKEFGPSPRFLQEIRMPTVDRSVCLASTNYTVSRNMFCAGYSQEIIGDACHGDSGGPFLMSHSDRWYLVGIVSWGEGCGLANKYGFYTRILDYLPWIKGIIKS